MVRGQTNSFTCRAGVKHTPGQQETMLETEGAGAVPRMCAAEKKIDSSSPILRLRTSLQECEGCGCAIPLFDAYEPARDRPAGAQNNRNEVTHRDKQSQDYHYSSDRRQRQMCIRDSQYPTAHIQFFYEAASYHTTFVGIALPKILKSGLPPRTNFTAKAIRRRF